MTSSLTMTMTAERMHRAPRGQRHWQAPMHRGSPASALLLPASTDSPPRRGPLSEQREDLFQMLLIERLDLVGSRSWWQLSWRNK